MKIVAFEDLHADAGWDTYSFLKIVTDEGLVGWGEFNEARGRRGLTQLVRSLCETIKGDDPRNLSKIEAALVAQTRPVAGGLLSHAIAPILHACLDIKARALGVPVYDLLGGAVRTRLKSYWSRCGVVRARYPEFFDGKVIEAPAVRTLADLGVAAREARDAGFDCMKTNLLLFDDKGARPYAPGSSRAPGHPELNADRALVRALERQMSALRAGAGDDAGLMVDLNFNYKAEGYRRFAQAMAPFDLEWLEMDIYDPAVLAGVRNCSSTPIASLETILGRKALKPFLDHGSADVAIIDVQYNGMPESLRMAAMCEAAEVNVASHCYNGPLSTVISAHFCAVIPNFRILELDIDEVPWRSQMLTTPYRVENGEFILPDGPGWGMSINEEVVKAHPPKA